MIGARKYSGVIRLLMAAALVLFVAACSSSDSGLKSERDQALDQVEELEGTVVDLTGTVDELRTQLAALESAGNAADEETIKMLEERIAELEKDLADAAAAEKRAAVLALFKGLNPGTNPVAAGGLPDADTDLAALGGRNDVPFADAQPTVALSVGHGRATKVTPVDAANTDDPGANFKNNKLADATGALSETGNADWTSTLVSAQDSGTKNTDTVVVVTDIDATEDVPFEEVFTLTDAQVVDADGAGNAKYIASPMFPTGPGVTIHNPDETEPDETEPDETIRIPGTFAGASGEYRCDEGGTEGTCMSQGTNNGVQLNGDWVFDPDTGAMAKEADDEYSYFGWWWRVASGDYLVDVFHGNSGGEPITDTEFNALTGTATYVGPAVGKFAISPQLPGTTAVGGHFTATATLTADFEEGEGENPAGEIKGSIHDFMMDDYQLPYEVTLGASAIDTTDTDTDTGVDDFRGSSTWLISGEKSSSTGTWSGNFQNQGRDNVPTTVTGEFATTYNEEVGRIEGAFGARK